MRQRLGIAQALLGNPSYVLLDEPTNGLDPEGIAELRAMIGRIRREYGTTVLVSSHQLAEIAEMCSRVGVIKHGKFVLEAPIEELVGSGGDAYRVAVVDREPACRALEQAGVESRTDRDDLIVQLGQKTPAELAQVLVDSGAGLSTFAPLKPSLEDVYLRCAADDGGGSVSVASEPVEVDRPAETIAPPWPMIRAFAYDVRRWAGHKVAWLLTAPAALAVIGIHGRFGEQAADAAELESGVLASATAVTAFEALGRGLRAGLPLLTFLAVGLASQAIAGEYSQGTLRNVLLRPVTRVRVAAGKALSTLLAVLLGYGLLWGGAMAAAAWWFDFGDVTEILPNGELYVYVDAEGLWAGGLAVGVGAVASVGGLHGARLPDRRPCASSDGRAGRDLAGHRVPRCRSCAGSQL